MSPPQSTVKEGRCVTLTQLDGLLPHCPLTFEARLESSISQRRIAVHIVDEHAAGVGGDERVADVATESPHKRRAMPIAIAYLQVILAAILRLEQLQLLHMQCYAFSVCGRDPPLADAERGSCVIGHIAASLVLGAQQAARVHVVWGTDLSLSLLIGASTGGTIVQQIRLEYVTATEPPSLTQLDVRVGQQTDGCNRIQIRALREGVLGVVHDRVVVVGQQRFVELRR